MISRSAPPAFNSSIRSAFSSPSLVRRLLAGTAFGAFASLALTPFLVQAQGNIVRLAPEVVTAARTPQPPMQVAATLHVFEGEDLDLPPFLRKKK